MNLYVFFTYNTSLQDWSKNGTLERELNYYNKFIKKGIKVTFITYGCNEEKFVKKFPGINTISVYNKNKSNSKLANLLKSLIFIIHFSKYNKKNIIIKSF